MSVDGDVWSCPDCHETCRGTLHQRVKAQLEHGQLHRTDRRVAAERRRIIEEEQTAERNRRKRARIMAKAERARLRQVARGQQ